MSRIFPATVRCSRFKSLRRVNESWNGITKRPLVNAIDCIYRLVRQNCLPLLPEGHRYISPAFARSATLGKQPKQVRTLKALDRGWVATTDIYAFQAMIGWTLTQAGALCAEPGLIYLALSEQR